MNNGRISIDQWVTHMCIYNVFDGCVCVFSMILSVYHCDVHCTTTLFVAMVDRQTHTHVHCTCVCVSLNTILHCTYNVIRTLYGAYLHTGVHCTPYSVRAYVSVHDCVRACVWVSKMNE